MSVAIMAKQEKIYTIDEIAELLKLDRKTVKLLIESGDLGAFYVRRQYRILQSDLDEYIDRNRVKKQEEEQP